MKRMKNHKHICLAVIFISILLMGMMMSSCGNDSGEQRYAYPLATASPEDTVTQIYAVKFAEEVERLESIVQSKKSSSNLLAIGVKT